MKTDIITLPNIITFIRLVITIFAAKNLIIGDFISSFVLYLIAIITDFFDGFLARRLKQISNLGKALDPIVDKIMIASAILILIYKDLMPIWYGIVFVICSLINLIGGLVLIKRYKYVPASIFVGKIAAVSIMITFLLNILLYFNIALHNDYSIILFSLYIISSIFLIASVVIYGYKSWKNINSKTA